MPAAWAAADDKGGAIIGRRVRTPAAQPQSHVVPSPLLAPFALLLHDADGDHLSFARNWKPGRRWLPRRGLGCWLIGRSAPVEPHGFKGLANAACCCWMPCSAAMTLVGHGLGAMLALEPGAPRCACGAWCCNARVGRL